MVVKFVVAMFLVFSAVVNADIFEKGKSNIGVSIGAANSLNQTYTIFGINASYFIVDNLAVGLRYRGWFGATPTQNEVAVDANYYIPLNQKFRPYVGAFVRQTFVNSDIIDDYASYGARGGLALTMSKNSFISVGYAIEYYDNCQVGDCSTSYPEFVLGLAF